MLESHHRNCANHGVQHLFADIPLPMMDYIECTGEIIPININDFMQSGWAYLLGVIKGN